MVNKRTLVLGIAILMIAMTAVVVFAQEANYRVTVEWETRGVRERDGTVITRPERRISNYNVTATSVGEADQKGRSLAEGEPGFGRIIRSNAVRL